MENQKDDLEKCLQIINNIQYLNFDNLDIFNINMVSKLLENENNLKYKESVTLLQNYMYFDPDVFDKKYRQFGIKKEVINAFYNILNFLPNGTLKAKIASVILIESKTGNIKKQELAKIAVENFVYDFDKIFNQNYIYENNIYFTIDLACKFQLFDKLKVRDKIKQIFNKQLDNTIDFKFTRLYLVLTNRFFIWGKNEHIKILYKLYKIATKRLEQIDSITNIPQAEIEKDIICNIFEIILFIINKIKKDKAKDYKYIQNKINNKIININLEFSKRANNTYKWIALEALCRALIIAKKQNNKKLIRDINKKIQSLNGRMLRKQEVIQIPLSQEQKNIIKQYELKVDDVLNNKDKNLFDIFRMLDCSGVNFDLLKDNGNLVRYLFSTIEYDSDNLISNIHSGQDDIFMNYRDCIIWYSNLCYILKTKLLQRFYPQKEYFYFLTYESYIIPKGYEELIARMLYCGIHNDYMDFFIYVGVSIEAILRNI